ncbi:hypothetical protein KUH03_32860 [Sphingobacterium sp. E70]|uniref:hypothetical protein n=1 Tax=Sphingobacterium sp. E70 TaxID=2853439 RepID=UPI00211C6DA7|nr:hypothetical protein [Sphingobacterium sp. E70]ULT23884.1 hypothetical protein KUH03_32860 [Sphingobacterium sp. E70]
MTKELQYPNTLENLEIPRSSEEDTWNQILKDYDEAIKLMLPKGPKSGYSNKFVALSFKSEAMLYAGSVAKYNETVSGRLTGLGRKTGVRVIGFDASTAKAASQKYFAEAYSAARQVMTAGAIHFIKRNGQRTIRRHNIKIWWICLVTSVVLKISMSKNMSIQR